MRQLPCACYVVLLTEVTDTSENAVAMTAPYLRGYIAQVDDSHPPVLGVFFMLWVNPGKPTLLYGSLYPVTHAATA